MSAVAFIPARGGSKGIPRKNLQLVNGVPLVARCIRAAIASDVFSEVFVSTEDPEIADVASQWGATVTRRPAVLALDSTTTEAVLDQWLETTTPAESMFLLQCTCPFTDAMDLRRAAERLVSPVDSVFAAYEGNRFLWTETSDGWAAVGHDKSVRLPRQAMGRRAIEAGNFYGVDVAQYRSEHTRFAGSTEAVLISEERSFDIDNEADLALAQSMAVRLDASPDAQIMALALDFDGVLTDNRVLVGGGEERALCNRSDGHWLGLLRARGIETVIITGERTGPAYERGAKLGVEVIGSTEKGDTLSKWIASRGLDPSTVAYVGNDVNDLPAFAVAGWSFAVADAHPSVRSAARVVLSVRGGEGVVAEVAGFIREVPQQGKELPQ